LAIDVRLGVSQLIGYGSFYHHAAGVFCVQSLIAQARGDERAHQLAVESLYDVDASVASNDRT
jgi:hypothetical protein